MRLVPFLVFFAALSALAEPAKPATKPPETKPAETKPANGPLTVAVVAALNDQTADNQVAALAGWVKATLGRDAREKVFNDYDQLAAAVSKGEVDVAMMGPLAVLRLDPKAKAALLFRTIRKGHPTYRSVLFAKNGSPLKNLDALRKAKGLKVGWVDPSSATGYIIPKAHLVQNGIDPVQVFVSQDFAGTHDAVCNGVVAGTYDVGATFASDPAPLAPKASGCDGSLGKKVATLTVITATAEIPNDALVAGPALTKGESDKLTAEAKKLAASDVGKKTLASAFLAEGVADVADADYDPVRRALDAFKR